ncbi:MAG: hypothetical protein QNK38_04180 [Nitrospirota bacterium]|jgi:hypothetical protein|nr:hypothetical protein [Nitrospirota bacterium]MDX2420262.1 hypothetical protein [Nitrospirota bacterium]
MKKFMVTMVTGLFLVGLGSLSLAGMTDDLLKKSDEATQKVNEANAQAQEGKQKLDAGQEINAESATKQGTGDMTQQLKGAAKEKSNETIDNLGK